MKFAALLQRTQRQSARVFTPDTAGRPLRAWFPPTATASPAHRGEYTFCAGEVTTGPLRQRTVEQLALIGVSGETLGLQLSRSLPYVPDKARTTLLLGHDQATAGRCRIIEMRSVGTFYEFDLERIAAPLDTPPASPPGAAA